MGDAILLDRETIGATEEKELSVDSATATTIVDADLTEADDFWNGSEVRLIRGAGVGQQVTVSDFVAITDTLTVGTMNPVPAAGTVYLMSRPAPAAEMFRAGEFTHNLNVEELTRAIRDSSLSPFKRLAGKRSASIAFSTELRGSGAAGTAPDYGLLFKACGMTETINAGVSVTYAPSSDKSNYLRAAITAWIDGLRFLFMGCMGTFTITIPLDGVPVVAWEFTAADFKVSDEAVQSGTAYDAQAPEPALAAAFSFGGFNFDATSITFALNNEVALRESANLKGGHINALVARRAPTGSFDPEAVLKATEDLWGKWEGKQELALSVQVGATAGNICTITAPKCQYGDIGLGDRGGALTYEAPFSMNRNTGDDEISIVFT